MIKKKTNTKRAATRQATKQKAPIEKKWTLPSVARAAGEKRYWLLKSEPDVFSFDDLLASPDQTTFWDGVRNNQARLYLRDQMKVGDGVLFYHSGTDEPAIAGLAEVVREGYPDHTAFDPHDAHFDPKARRENPWIMVDVRAVRRLAQPLTLAQLREVPALAGMVLLQKGSRLSVQPVSAAEWDVIQRLAR